MAFLRASEIDPGQHVVLGNLAISYQRLKKYDQAIESYRKAIAALAHKTRSPGGGGVLSQYGHCPRSQG